MTRAIVRKDLTVMWASPIPYVVGALLHLALGLLYVDQLEIRRQAVIQPLFPLAGFLLLVMAPLLTMRSFAEEARTGTLDLLQAVPVGGLSLVLGKWIAAWLTSVVVFAPSGLYVVLLYWFGTPDAGPIAAGFLGLVLLLGAVTGLGVLASSVSSSQPVAAVLALFVSLLFWFVDVASDAPQAESVLLRFSLRERLHSFAGGAVDSSDVTFFVLLLVVSLVLGVQAVEGRRLR